MLKIALLVSLGLVVAVYGHGRLMKPPGRSTVWRIPEFASQNPPVNYNDNELFCGGLHQADDPGSNCGVCGDAKTDSTPRANELGGTYDAGIITGRYSSGQVIDIEVNLTQAHKGFMEWRMCTNVNDETQDCFNRNVLRLADGSGTKFPAGDTGMHYTKVQLPQGVTCSRCVIQWNYRAGNGWGDCGNGTSATGCGPQETFRGCSDVSIS